MPSKPEDKFRAAVNKHLPSDVYQEKTSNPFRAGIPDDYYESYDGILWVEFKYAATMPTRQHTLTLSPLQIAWLDRARRHRIPCAVCLGVKKPGSKEWYGMLIRDRWEKPITTFIFHPASMVAAHIADSVRRTF